MPWILGSFTMLVCSHPGTGTVVAKASHGLRSNRSWKGHLHLVVFIRQQSVPTFGGGPDTRHQRLLPCLWPTSGGYWKDADVLGPNKRKPIHMRAKDVLYYMSAWLLILPTNLCRSCVTIGQYFCVFSVASNLTDGQVTCIAFGTTSAVW